MPSELILLYVLLEKTEALIAIYVNETDPLPK